MQQALAQALIKKGRTVSLARDIGPQPVLMYHVTFPGKRERVDVVLDRFDLVYHGFTITHVDALCHVAWDGELYNGRPFADSLTTAGAIWCPIDALFERHHDIVVCSSTWRRAARKVSHGGSAGDAEGVDEVAARAGVKVQPGGLVVVRSGNEGFLKGAIRTSCSARSAPRGFTSRASNGSVEGHRGDLLGHDGRAAERLSRLRHAHASGNSFLDWRWWTTTYPERLAKVCAEEGRNEFLFTATPLRILGSTGAPAHPIAIF